MANCIRCHAPLSDNDEFCGNCGQAATPRAQAVAAALTLPAPEVRSAAAPVPVTGGLQPGGPASGDGQAGAAHDVHSLRTIAAAPLVTVDVVGEPSFDPLRNKRYLGQVARRLLLYFLAAAVIEAVILVFGLIFSLIGGFAIGALALVVTVIVAIGLWMFFWLMPVAAMLSFGSKVVAGHAPAAPLGMPCIMHAFNLHGTPHDSLQIRSMSLPGEGRRDYIELRRGHFAGYITCFPHGGDLYMGWTFWIYMSPFRMVLMRFGRAMQNFSGRGNDLYQTLRYESVRATVGAIQICTTEGLEAALSQAAGGQPYSMPEGLEVPIG
jgi:hypothetical protein